MDMSFFANIVTIFTAISAVLLVMWRIKAQLSSIEAKTQRLLYKQDELEADKRDIARAIENNTKVVRDLHTWLRLKDEFERKKP